MKTQEFKGIIAAVATGFSDDESINLDRTSAHVEKMISAGADAIFCLGTNGEFYTMSYDEKLSVLEKVISTVDGRLPVYAGTGTTTTKETIRLSQAAADMGADAVSVITPYFAAAGQDELKAHFESIAQAVNVPILMYNIPARTGNKLEPETVEYLSTLDNIVGIKDSSGDFENIKAYIELTKGQNFSVLSGNDGLILDTLMAGGNGGITAIANVYPETMVQIYRFFLENNLDGARQAQESIAPLRSCLKLGNPNTIVKTAANMYGNVVGPCRAPFNRLSDKAISEISRVLEESRKLGIR